MQVAPTRRYDNAGAYVSAQNNPKMWVPWAGFCLLAALYMVLGSVLARGGTKLMCGMFLILVALCFFSKHWPPLLVMIGIFYIVPNPTGSSGIAILFPLFFWMLTVFGLSRRTAGMLIRQSQTPRAPLCFLVLGFMTALFWISEERFGLTLYNLARLSVVLGIYPFLCGRLISPKQVRLCILILAAGIVVYYSCYVFMLVGRQVADMNQLESVSGDLVLANRTIELTRTHVGPAVAIACCTLFGILLSERKFVLRLTSITLMTIGTITIMYTGARGALGSEILVCFLVAFFAGRQKRGVGKLILLGSFLFVGGILALALWVWAPDASSVISLRLENTTFAFSEYSRISRWLGSLQFFISHPMGVGWTLTPLGAEEHAHNDMLIMAMSFGVFGLLAYVVAFRTEYMFLIRRMRAPNTAGLALCLPSLACLMALFVCGFMDMMLVVGGMFDASWLIVVLARGSNTEEG